jgi:hypothetical protein
LRYGWFEGRREDFTGGRRSIFMRALRDSQCGRDGRP